MKEIDELRKRVTALEVSLEVSQMASEAQQKIIFAILQTLHEEKKLPMQLVLQKLESSHAFAQAAFDVSMNECLKVLIQSLRQIQEAYAESGRIGR